MIGRAVACALLLGADVGFAQPPETAEGRGHVQQVTYREGDVVQLHGHLGYALDVELEAGERVVNVAAGNLAAVDIGVEGSHLFLKPRRVVARMNLIVLTDRRTYRLDYHVDGARVDGGGAIAYAVVFAYPQPERVAQPRPAPTWNADYWYCGAPELRPAEAFDDGARTYLRFGPAAEFPVAYLVDADGAERLINTHVAGDWIVVHQIAGQLRLRRGRLTGCVTNRAAGRQGREPAATTVGAAAGSP